MRALHGAIVLLVVPALAVAYQADIVPATSRIEARDITGSLSINGADGTIRVKIESVSDARGDSLNGQLSVRLRLRVNGARRRVTIVVPVDEGDGEASQSLGLVAGDQVIVNDVRVRGPDHRLLAQPGTVTFDTSVAPPPEPPPSPAECPAVLESCQSDLADCTLELDACEAQ